MKLKKTFTLLSTLCLLGYASFYITYEKVSAIVMKEAEEMKKNEIVIKPIIIEEEEEEKEESIIEDENIEKVNQKTNNFIFIGDSRIDSFKSIAHNINFDSIEFITSENADCDWMRNSGLSELNHILNSNPGHYNIVFNVGINDLNNIDRYVNFFNDLANQHPNQNIFVLGIFPLDELKFEEENDIFINNDDIYDFNIEMKKNVNNNVHIIHTFQELILNGYDTVDGYYLEEETSLSLLNFIWNHVNVLETENV